MNLTTEHLILFVVLIQLYSGIIKDERERGSFSDYTWSIITAGVVMGIYMLFLETK